MIDALLADLKVVSAFRREGLEPSRPILQALLTALAAQPEGETLEQAVLKELREDASLLQIREEQTTEMSSEAMAGVNVLMMLPSTLDRYEEILVNLAAPLLTAPLHARVATLEAEKANLRQCMDEKDAAHRNEENGLRNTLATVEAERDTLREAAEDALAKWNGTNGEEAFAILSAALTGGGR